MITELVISIAPKYATKNYWCMETYMVCGVSPAKLRVANIMESNSKNIMEYHGLNIGLWTYHFVGRHQDSCHPNRCPHIIIPGHLGTGHRPYGGVYQCISNEKKCWEKYVVGYWRNIQWHLIWEGPIMSYRLLCVFKKFNLIPYSNVHPIHI